MASETVSGNITADTVAVCPHLIYPWGYWSKLKF